MAEGWMSTIKGNRANFIPNVQVTSDVLTGTSPAQTPHPLLRGLDILQHVTFFFNSGHFDFNMLYALGFQSPATVKAY